MLNYANISLPANMVSYMIVPKVSQLTYILHRWCLSFCWLRGNPIVIIRAIVELQSEDSSVGLP